MSRSLTCSEVLFHRWKRRVRRIANILKYAQKIASVVELSERTDSSPAGRDQVRTTTVDFHQVGYDERSEYFESNKTAWGKYYKT
jgi:hypothetical protein